MASPSFTVFLRTTPTRKPIARTIRAETTSPDPRSNENARDVQPYTHVRYS